MKERDEIEDLFSSAFSDFEKMPPPDLKSAIDEQLFTIPEKKRKKGYIWIMSAMALLIGLLWFGYEYFDDTKENEQLVSASSAVSDSKDQGLSITETSDSGQKDVSEDGVSRNGQEEQIKINEGSGKAGSDKDQEIDSKGGMYSEISDQTPRKIKNRTTGKSKKKTGLTNKSGSGNERNEVLSEVISKDPFNTPGDTEVNNPVINPDVQYRDETDTKTNDLSAIGTPEPKDSALSKAEPAPKPTPEVPKGTDKAKKNWSLTLTAGATYGLSKLNRPSSPEYFMKEEPGFAIGIESSFMMGQKFGLTTGLDMNKRTDIFYQEVLDSIYAGQTYKYIYDYQVLDSIIDSVLVDVYEYSGSKTQQQERINHVSVAVPVFLTVAFPLTQKLSMEVNGGFRFSYVSNKLSSNEFSLLSPTFKSFGIRGSLRPQIIYKLDNGIGIGGYLNVGYDIIPAVEWDAITRSRMDLGGGILLRYSF